MRIIPAIDILNGKCVRLTKGDYNSATVYEGNPVETALRYEELGFRYLHLVDLDGAREKHIVHHAILEKITRSTSLRVDFGGGIKSGDDISTAFSCGAAQVNIGTLAATNPETFIEWLTQYGPERVILSADSVNRMIMISGWEESTNLEVTDYISGFRKKGLVYAVCTDISRDGMLRGPATDLYKEIISGTGVKLIASGGISSLPDLGLLEDAGCEGAIIGKAIYEGKIDLSELSKLC